MKAALDILFSRKIAVQRSIKNEEIALEEIEKNANSAREAIKELNQAVQEIDKAIKYLQNGETDVKSKNSRKSKKTEPTSTDS